MPSFADRLLALVNATPGLTDRELTDTWRGKHAHPSQVNQEARLLEQRGDIVRKQRLDGRIGNYPASPETAPEEQAESPEIIKTPEGLSEDELKKHLERWLISQGWQARIAWGRSKGVDIHATRNTESWIIEVKGLGSLQAMRVNYFIAMLGETLQRMADPHASYSIALPDILQYRRLWARLPALAKQRTRITALFVKPTGEVAEDPCEQETGVE
jgi:hypothetical protein